MNPLLVSLVAAGVAVPFLYVLAPGMFLRLGLLIYPKGHDRCRELEAELHYVPFWKRPFWVAGNLVGCFFEGPPARSQARQARKGRSVTDSAPSTVYRPEWEQDQAIREWARNQGMNITDNEPIPKDAMDGYYSA